MRPNTPGLLALLGLLAVALVCGTQLAVGDNTLYGPALEAPRENLHRAILTNTPPPGGWSSIGATKDNVRIATVFLAEGLRRATGLPLREIYRGLDSTFLVAFLLGLFAYLRTWLDARGALLGVLFVCAVLPLTYVLHYFHPWDRIQLCLWLVLLHLVRARRPLALGVVLLLSLLVKYDTVFVPLLYAMVHLRRENARRVLPEALVLGALTVAVILGMDAAFNPGAQPARFSLEVAQHELTHNLDQLAQLWSHYPPLLMHGVPLALALVRLRTRERFLQAGVLFGGLMSLVWLVFTTYAEVRAQTMLLLLLLPPALLTLEEALRALGRTHTPGQTG